MLRIILIIGIIGCIGVVAFVMLQENNQVLPDNPDQSDVQFPESQDIVEVPNTNEIPIVQNFEPTSVDYQVKELPVNGLVTSIVSSDPSEEFSNVLSEIFIDVYWRVQCQLPNGSTEEAVILTAKPSVEEGGGDIDLARYAIRNWEPYVAKDLGDTLFPKISSSLDSTVLNFTNYDKESRFANFAINNKNYEVHYGWVLNFAIFSTSHNCLIAAINDTYAPQGH